MKPSSINLAALRFLWKEQRWYLPVLVLRNLFSNLAPFATLYFSALVVNELAGVRNLHALLLLVILTLGINLVVGILSFLLNYAADLQEEKYLQHERVLFNKKVLHMDYAHLENPDIRDKRQRILESININEYGIWFFIRVCNQLISSSANVLFAIGFSMGLITIILHKSSQVAGLIPFLIVFLLLIGAYVFVAMKKIKKSMAYGYEFSNEMLKINRIGRGYQDYRTGKDIRLFGLIKIYTDAEAESYRINRDGFSKISKSDFKYGVSEGILNQAITGVIYSFVCLNALRGLFPIGYVITFVGYIARLTSGVNDLFTTLSSFKYNEPFLRAYLEFFDIPNTMYHGTLPVEKRTDCRYDIEFRNVSFRYPGSDRDVIKHLNLKIRIGKRMAVVGMNGSGKTTMIKLLCRLYDPTEGEILLNGIDIKKYNYGEYMSLFSVVFQDFKLFSFPLAENVAASMDVDSELAEKSLRIAGLGDRLSSLPKGLSTPLNKDFDEDGMEISGGEAQKVALARALYKDAPFVVLDEPTAALDPLAEYDIYTRFNEIVGSKTAIYISHRLSSCRFCHDIIVFHEGELIQRGGHDALIADKSGKYYELWHAQAQHYTDVETASA